MCMLSERVQILLTPEQRRRLEAEARRSGRSVASLVREALDERYGVVTREDRIRAVDEIRALRGRYLSPEELERVFAEERDAAARPGFG
jgi:hypothetical protein